MLLWIAIQLIVLLAGCAGIADRHALTILITSQVIASSLLAPILFRNWTTGICAMLASVPFIHLAAILSAAPMITAVRVGLATEMWLLALLFAASAAQSAFSRALLATIASAITIGGAMLVYLRNEFGEPMGGVWETRPITIGLSTAVFIGLILALTTRYVQKRQVIHQRC